MLKKFLGLILVVVSMSVLLTGCAGIEEKEAYEAIKNAEPLSISEVTGTRLSAAATSEDIDTEIFNYIADRIVVDSSLLIAVDGQDERNINNLLANINTQLSGKELVGVGSDYRYPLTEEYANYLLLEFARTPFEWTQSSKKILGFDPSARLYFVDVTYATTNAYKNIVPNSKIPNGDPEFDTLRNQRYKDYITMLTFKMNNNEDRYQECYDTFVNRWGNIEDIFAEQQGVSLYERTKLAESKAGGIGRLTYEGLMDGSSRMLDEGAVMTVRYVLKYALNLGEETDLGVEALYIKDFKLNNYEKILENYELNDVTSLEVLKPFIDKLIWSYNKCVEESNAEGLYSLYYDYSNIDKYYDEIRDYTYNSIGAYTYRVLQRKGHEVVIRVDRVNQIRARGAEMSLPTYEETLLFVLELSQNDKILIKNIYMLNRNLIGEPLSVIRNVSGISEQIQYSSIAFSDDNKAAVEKVLQQFSQLVTNGDYSSGEFLNIVDLGISQTVLNRMSNAIKAITPVKKATYIVSWNTTTNVYCSVTIREVFQCDNGNFDTEAVVDLGNRNGTWKVVNYTRNINIKTGLTDLTPENTKGALCLDSRTVGGDTTKVNVEDKAKTEVYEGKDVDNNKPSSTPEPTPSTPSSSGSDEPVEPSGSDTPIQSDEPSGLPSAGGGDSGGDFD